MSDDGSRRPIVGWIVDVQNDFMLPPEEGGRLYVRDVSDPADPGARAAADTIERAVRWLREHADALVFTGDWHSRRDDEIDPDDPDPVRGTYPPHCLGLSDDPDERRGALIIDAIRPDDPLILGRDADARDARELARAALEQDRPVFIHKSRFDVFEGNPGAGAFLDGLARLLGGSPEIVVLGVSRDVCVTRAIDAMQAMGYRTTAVRDATWGLGLEPESETLERWSRGGRVIDHEDLLARSW